MNAPLLICLAILLVVMTAAAIAWRLAGAVVRDRDEVTTQRRATNAIGLAHQWQRVQNDELTLKMREQALALGTGEAVKPAPPLDMEVMQAEIERQAEKLARRKMEVFDEDRRRSEYR